jgi:hypothetical protein
LKYWIEKVSFVFVGGIGLAIGTYAQSNLNGNDTDGKDNEDNI